MGSRTMVGDGLSMKKLAIALLLIASPAFAQKTAVSDSDTLGQPQYNFPAGFVRTTDEPHQIFYDPFDAALDTTNRWTTPTVGNSAVLASTTAGVMSMGTGTTASGWSKLFSQPSFIPSIPAWLGFSFAINLPDGAAPTANAYRFWGAGTPATTPTTAAPMTNAVGFELTTTGALVAVVYAGGTRTQVADLSSATGNGTQPLDTASHRYIVYVRTDKTYWYIDSLNTPVATSNFQAPQVQTLPMAMVAVGGATPPGSNTQIQSSGLAVWDTGKNSVQMSDGTFPWRKATITAGGGLQSGSQYPAGAVAITGSGTGSTAAVTGTLTAAATATTAYICGFSFQGSDATAAVNSNIAVTGTITGTMNFGYVALASGATIPQPGPVTVQFTPCVQASAVNTNIVVTSPALGAGAPLATVSVWGYRF